MKIKDSSRRFSVDSVPRHRRMLRIFRKECIIHLSTLTTEYEMFRLAAGHTLTDDH